MNMSDLASFAAGVLQQIDAPATAANIQFLEDWASHNENTAAANNPLATKQKMAGSYDLPGNSPGDTSKVQQYASLQDGIVATAKTLLNGNYGDIIGALKSGNAAQQNATGQLAKGLSTWSGAGYTQVNSSASLSPEQYADQSLAGSSYRAAVQSAAASPELDEQDLASEYGFAASFFGSDPELQGLIGQAVSEQWTPQQFQAKFQATKWYQSHAQSVRDFIALQTSDPATFQSKLTQQEADLRNQAAAMGATLSPGDLTKLATNALEFGWDTTQTTQALATHISATGATGGQAEDTLTSLKSYVASMGVNIPDTTMNNYVQQIEAGTSSTGAFQGYVRKLAASAFPAYANQINAGTTVADIASPYTSDMASILEVNPSSITLDDPTIRKMLTGTDQTGQPVQTGLWDFEKSLRSDPRWQYTQNATNSVYSTLSTIGKNWGLST